jgi:hypothetical protein
MVSLQTRQTTRQQPERKYHKISLSVVVVSTICQMTLSSIVTLISYIINKGYFYEFQFRLTLGATCENIILSESRPLEVARFMTLAAPTAGNFNSHNMLLGTFFRISIHMSRVAGSILYN